ncbi:MAG TPA: hypothetical protein VKP64_02135 [Mycobacteriales bacterium]|nr:hypothetical protein [Mycobacteriales bacterium]
MLVAHGIGGRQDLPIPFTLAVTGAAVTLVVSFAALAVLWRTPVLRGSLAGRPLPAAVQRVADGPVPRRLLQTVGVVATAYVAAAALVGPDSALNPMASVVYVLFWVGLVPASLLFGPVWRALNPLRAVHRGIAGLMGTKPHEGLRPLPDGIGYWPAAAGLAAFAWMELVAPDRTSLGTLRTFFGVYAGAHLLAAAFYGSRWFDKGDGFEVYSSLVGRLAPVGRRADGRVVLRNPLDGLAATPIAPGLVPVVAVLLGSTAYDGMSNAPFWARLTQDGPLPPVLLGTLGLFGMMGVVALTYSAAVAAAGRLGEPDRRPGWRSLPGAFAHSIVPIVVGYAVAHYFSLLVFEGQHAFVLLSDPLGTGADLLGTGGRGVDYSILTPAFIAGTQVVAVVTGHMLGVVAAHDRAVSLFARRDAVRGQLPLLLLMVGYTIGGLLLLFAG